MLGQVHLALFATAFTCTDALVVLHGLMIHWSAQLGRNAHKAAVLLANCCHQSIVSQFLEQLRLWQLIAFKALFQGDEAQLLCMIRVVSRSRVQSHLFSSGIEAHLNHFIQVVPATAVAALARKPSQRQERWLAHCSCGCQEPSRQHFLSARGAHGVVDTVHRTGSQMENLRRVRTQNLRHA